MTTYYGPYTYADLEPLALALRHVCDLADLDYTQGLYADSASPGVSGDKLEERILDLNELIRAATRARDELNRILHGEGTAN